MNQDLLYSELMLIETLPLIKRYNRALKKACGIETKLSQFHIDCSGYSPEIAKEFSDPDYLNSNGVNKRFIIISIKQKDLPIARSHFSSTAEFLKDFMCDNAACLLTLTALDAVFGELENNIYRIKTLVDIINADRVEVRVDTPSKVIEKAVKLQEKIDTLSQKDSLTWLASEPIEELIELAQSTGDIRYNTLVPENINYKKTCYFTRHLGGMYVFKGFPKDRITIIPLKNLINTVIPENVDIIALNKRADVYEFLMNHGFIVDLDLHAVSSNKEALREKKFQIVIDFMVKIGHSTYKDTLDPYDIKHFIQENFEQLPENFTKFYRILAEIERNEEIDSIDEELAFYLCQPSETEFGKANQPLIKHLLANYTPYSYMSNFQYNRELFIKQHASWSNEKQEYVESYLLKNISSVRENTTQVY